MIRKEAVVTHFNAVPRCLPGGAVESNEKPRSGQPISSPTHDPGTLRIRSRNVNHSAATSVPMATAIKKIHQENVDGAGLNAARLLPTSRGSLVQGQNASAGTEVAQ